MLTPAKENYKEPELRFAFQHFDQETDFGVEDANGKRIRKKKRPGRKPNPPTPQQKRAQNRAAQKAFRAREQLKMREKERQQNEEFKSLKRQLAIAQYEVKYLQAYVLHLTLASLMYRGSIPHFWTETRMMPNKPYNANEVNETPAHLAMLLNNEHVIDLDQALKKSTQYNNYMQYKNWSGSDLTFQHFQEFIAKEKVPLNKQSQDPSRCLPKYKSTVHSPSSFPRSPTSMPSTPTLTKELDLDDEKDNIAPTIPTVENTSQALIVQEKPIRGVIFEPPSFKTASDLASLPPLQALHVLRLQLKISSILGELASPSLIPTALQRLIPHDVRIDYIPGPGIRDRMILFQGLYDIDECFRYVTETGIFIGGDVRNAKNWHHSPEYSVKFWFLSHQLIDENVDECVPRFEIEKIIEHLRTEEASSLCP